ncbi:MAG: sensor histidine kinase [bacterium]
MRTSRLEEQAQYGLLHQIYDSVINEASKREDKLTEAFFTRLKGRAYLNEDKYDSAYIFAGIARDLAVGIGNDSILGLALLNIATINRKQGEVDSALHYYTTSLKIFKDTKDTANMADVLQGLMNYYRSLGELDKAIEAGLKSNYLFKKMNRTINYIESLNDLANVYERLGALDTAMACYQQVYRLSIENKLPRTTATAMNNIAVVYYRKGDNESSMEYLLRAIAFNDSVGDKGELAMLYGNISYLYDIKGDQEQKVASLERSLQYATEINHVGRQLSTMIRLGDHYNRIGDLATAEKYYLQGFELARRSKQRESARNVSEMLSDYYAQQNRWKKSTEYLRLALAYQDSLVDAEKARVIEKALSNNRALTLDDMIKEIKTEHKAEIARILKKSQNLLITLLLILVILLGLLLYFRMRARKNRIITEQKIRQLENERKLMRAQAVMVGQENERKRIAHDLHDGIGVLLSTASVQFSRIKMDPETAPLFEKATQLITEASGEIRKISRNMMPGVLSKLGLYDALEDLFETVNGMDELQVHLKLDDHRERLPENTEIMLYRIVQELVNNTVKHAKASEITFELSREGDKIQMIYADNGTGFDPEDKMEDKGLGLAGIRSRTDLLGGTMKINAEKGNGTHYTFQIPF